MKERHNEARSMPPIHPFHCWARSGASRPSLPNSETGVILASRSEEGNVDEINLRAGREARLLVLSLFLLKTVRISDKSVQFHNIPDIPRVAEGRSLAA